MALNSWEELERALSDESEATLGLLLDELGPGELSRALSRLSEKDRQALFSAVGPERGADMLETLPPLQAAGLVQEISPEQAATILTELPSHEQVQVLSEVKKEDAEEILSVMALVDAGKVRDIRAYSEEEAGSLLVLDPSVFSAEVSVGEVIDSLRSKSDEVSGGEAFYLYVVDTQDRLIGVVPLRRLIVADPTSQLSELMVHPVSVHEHLDLEEVEQLFHRYGFLALPVVDGDEKILGTIERTSVEREQAEQEQELWLETQGIVGGEELRSLPTLVRSRRRLSWLSVNVVLNLIAASVIGYYQDTLASVLALAMFLPIISDMSGCSGNQAVAVSLRELSLGVVRPIDLMFVLRKELAVGVLNGLALGLLLGGVAWLWQGSPYLGLVVGGALAVNTVVAVSLGGCVPLVLTRLGFDPALSSGPILTTVTDMCGFFLALSFATSLLSRLTAG